MKVTAEIHAPGYGPIVESFKSMSDALAYIADPSSVVPLGGEPHGRSYWPCWPESRDEWGAADEYGRVSVALVWVGACETEHDAERYEYHGPECVGEYPDYVVEIGPRDGLHAVRA